MSATVADKRSRVPFTWSASCGMPAYAVLAGVRFDRLFLDAGDIVEAYTRGRPMAQELFGPDVHMGGPMCAGISYGHINGLGSKLIFPEGSEVAHTPIYGSLAEGVRALKREVDFQTQGMFPFYLDLWAKLKEAFPQQKIGFGGFGHEGPITTGWLLRGHEFFADLIEEPDRAKEYLALATQSIIAYVKLTRRINGQPEFSEQGVGLADDGSSMISPARWPELVVPFIEQYYQGLTSGRRSAHIEDLKPPHLRYLDVLDLSSYDPSVSPKLTPALIRDHCRVPFSWRLNCTHYADRTPEDIERWVVEAAADGASGVTTVVSRTMCTEDHARKLRAFIRAGKRVKELLSKGCTRECLRQEAGG